ncbi:MAG: PD-(D/E)XK nuclease family protein, partial [Cyanobacteria bacterium P01_A01_bin.37]
MRLSQAHLTLIESCPRKFQYVYLDQVVAPVSPDDQYRREWGTHFHLMMQQRELGIT